MARARWYPAVAGAIVVLVGGGATVAAAAGRYHADVRTVDDRAANQQAQLVEQLNEGIATYATVLDAASAFYASSDRVDPGEFVRYGRSLDLGRRYPGLERIVFVEPIAWEDRGEFGARFAVDIVPGTTPEAFVGPAHELAVTTMVTGGAPPAGADLAADPIRARALAEARDLGGVTMSAPVVRIADRVLSPDERHWAFSLYAPVYRDGTVPAGLDERRAQFVGWMAASLRVTDVIDAFHLDAGPLRMAVFAGTDPLTGELMSSTAAPSWVRDHQRAAPAVMSAFGQSWAVLTAPNSDVGVSFDWLIVGGVGAAGTLLLTALVWVLASQRARLAHQVTRAVAAHESTLTDLAREATFQRALVERLEVGVLVYDARGLLRTANRAAIELLGEPVKDLAHLGASALKGLSSPDATTGLLVASDATDARRMLQDGMSETELVIDRPGRARRVATVSVGDVIDEAGTSHGAVVTMHDITELKDAEARLAALALVDGLTGLPNRTLFLDRLAGAVHRLERDPDARVAVFFVDLDQFKLVNDMLGHARGDDLLRAVGTRLCGALRGSDHAARFGGDEFVVCCEHVATDDQAAGIAVRLRVAVRGAIAADPDVARQGVDASVGWTLSRPGDDAGALLHRADQAMYEAKRLGRANA